MHAIARDRERVVSEDEPSSYHNNHFAASIATELALVKTPVLIIPIRPLSFAVAHTAVPIQPVVERFEKCYWPPTDPVRHVRAYPYHIEFELTSERRFRG